ncbi:MAG: glycosyltransferase [Candidatus Peregrinibacteria bacterium]|nr:glycosyltransferase [Candidatus Peregrinibacteria bacterium]
MQVSLCLIVKDEEKHLGTCLESFRNLYDELIVVDTGSSDDTKVIAEEYGARVFDFEWIDDFSAARNFALSKATGDWIMSLDADDTIEPEVAQELRSYLEEGAESGSVISLPYVYHRLSGAAGNTATLPRLWKRELELKYFYPIHEYLEVSKVPSSDIRRLDFPIIHNKSTEEYAPGFERNVKILEAYIKNHPGDLRILYYLVHDNKQLGRFDDAVRWAEKYLEAESGDLVKRAKLLIHKGQCHVKLRQGERAQEAFLGAMNAAPELIEPYLEMGDMNYRAGRYKKAIELYDQAKHCSFPENSLAFHNRAIYDYFAIRKLCYILPMVGRYNEALKYAKETLRYTPGDKKLIHHIETLKAKL